MPLQEDQIFCKEYTFQYKNKILVLFPEMGKMKGPLMGKSPHSYAHNIFEYDTVYFLNWRYKNPVFEQQESPISSMNESYVEQNTFQEYYKSKWNNKSKFCPSNRCGSGKLCQVLH